MRAEPPASEPPTFTVRAGCNGEALVTSPSGQMEFMNLREVFLFAIRAFRAGYKVEVQDG